MPCRLVHTAPAPALCPLIPRLYFCPPPPLQSYVLATDRVGLDIWLANRNVFACWDSMWDVIWHGELGR